MKKMTQSDKASKEYLAEQLAITNTKLIECQANLKMNKLILDSVLSGKSGELDIALNRVEQLSKEVEQKDKEIEGKLFCINLLEYTAQILVLKKINIEMEIREKEREKELNERVEEIKVKLERTENMFQSKEKKWGELERIVVGYARKDHDLRKKLSEIKYICDDPSSKRRITTVVEENQNLKSQIDLMEKEMIDLRSQVTYVKSNPTCMYDDEEDLFKITMHFHEDEIRIDKKRLSKKSPLNVSSLSDNKNLGDLNKAFVDKSRIDTSNLMCDDNSIVGTINLDKSNISTNE